MKKTAFNLLVLLYFFSSIIILCMAMLWLFAMQFEESHGYGWTGWILYPLTILVCASMETCIEWITKHSKN